MMKMKRIVCGAWQVNTYVVWDSDSREAFIIDPGFEEHKIIEVLNAKDLMPQFILNTHGHIDHIGCNDKFGLPIYIHEADASFLTDPTQNLSMIFDQAYTSPPASRLLKEGDSITCGALSFSVIHTPGHTPGCICFLGHDVLFTGDTLFRESIGRTDLPYSDSRAIIESILKKIRVLDDALKIFPGHGESSTLEWEKKHNFYLSRCTND